jgi:phosphatidylglycerol:prolipoprotein diacylglycerol transferase
MYPTISDLLRDLTGINIPLPIQSFGFFVALSFILGAWAMAMDLKRKEEDGLLKSVEKQIMKGAPATYSELIITALTAFILGYKILFIFMEYREFADNPQGLLLSLKGSFIGGFLSAAIFTYLKYSEKEKEKLQTPVLETVKIRPHELMGNITLISALSGIIGAKIFHNLENLNEFIEDPMGALLSFSGLTFYGGLIFGTIAVLWYGKKNGIHWKHMVDASAPGLMLAYGIGRIGCQVAGDGDWGIVNTLPQPSWLSFLPSWTWSYQYPHNVIGEGIPISDCFGKHCYYLEHPVYPTPLYEAVIGIGLFFLLWNLRKRIKIPGMLFSVYLLLNGIERFFIEKIRVNTFYHIFGYSITQAEIISFALIIAGITGIILLRKNKETHQPG